MDLPDVVGVGVGMENQRPVLMVFSRRGRPVGLPPLVEGVEVRGVESGEFIALAPPAETTASGLARRKRPPTDQRPTVQFVNPLDGETCSGEVALQIKATDDKGVVSVAVYYQDWDVFYSGGGEPVFLGWPTYSGTNIWVLGWDTELEDDSHYILWAEATDTAGQNSSTNIAVFVDNQPGEPPEYSPDRWGTTDPSKPPHVSPIGVSVGNQYELAAGTLGCRVRDSSGQLYILSNNHVLARLNRARPGEWIFQPELYDTGGGIPYAGQRVARLSRFRQIVFSPVANNRVDAAIAQIDVGLGVPLVDVQAPVAGYGTPRADHFTNQELAQIFQGGSFAVQKYGRSTRLTSGTVTSISTTVIVSYGASRARFVDQIVVTGNGVFIQPGDSGSLLVTREDTSRRIAANRPVGLIFAGNSTGTQGIANRIADVLSALSVTIDGESP
jgi:hypothetical protein